MKKDNAKMNIIRDSINIHRREEIFTNVHETHINKIKFTYIKSWGYMKFAYINQHSASTRNLRE